jgi:hypothetical protein
MRDYERDALERKAKHGRIAREEAKARKAGPLTVRYLRVPEAPRTATGGIRIKRAVVKTGFEVQHG